MGDTQTKKFYELGIFIPLLTVFAIAGVYYYELGYFYHYGIPFELIQIELSKHIPLIFAFSLIVFIAPLAINVQQHLTKKLTSKRYETIVVIIVFMAPMVAILRAMIKLSENRFSLDIYYLIMCFVSGTILVIAAILKQEKEMANSGDNNFLNSDTFGYTGFSMIIASMFCIFSFYMGVSEAKAMSEYNLKPSKNTFLLRKYSNYTIYGITDSIPGYCKEFIVARSKIDADTLVPSE